MFTTVVRRRVLLVTATAVIVGGVGLGVARASQHDATSSVPNTAGSAGHARVIAGALRVTDLTQTEQSVLDAAGATNPSVVATVGSGSHAARLLQASTPAGSCLTVSHADGNIVEPLNCSSNAYLRVWQDTSGDGVPAAVSNAQSYRLIAVASIEVSSVQVAFANGSTRILTPDANGVVALEGGGGAHRAVSVTALGADGAGLATVNL